jgi:glutamate-ammonia-ligase adenylyltransferase
MEWLARSDGYTATGTSSAAEVFTAERIRHAGTVRRLHEKLFYRPLLHAVAAVGENEMRLSPEAARARLAALGFQAPEAALRHLAALTVGVRRRAAIQRTLLPVMLDYFSSRCPKRWPTVRGSSA